jgi:hypothetical protein
MRNGMKPSLRIGLSSGGIALLRTSGWLRTRSDLLSNIDLQAEESALPELLAARLSQMLTDTHCSHLPTTIVLAHELVRLFIVTPPHNTSRLQDCQAAAEMRFQTLYGEPAAAWQLEAAWDARLPFVVCAVPRALLAALQQLAATHRLTLIEVVPQFIAAWSRWRSALKSDAWFGLAHANRLILGAIENNRLCATWSVATPAPGQNSKRWLEEHVTREALRLNLPMPNRVQLCGASSEPWSLQSAGSLVYERLDAGRSVRSTPSSSANVVLAQTGMTA